MMNNDFNPDDWTRLEERWQEHYQRINEIARKGTSSWGVSPSKRRLRYAAAVAVVLLMGGAALRMGLRKPAPDCVLAEANVPDPQVNTPPTAHHLQEIPSPAPQPFVRKAMEPQTAPPDVAIRLAPDPEPTENETSDLAYEGIQSGIPADSVFSLTDILACRQQHICQYGDIPGHRLRLLCAEAVVD